MMVADCFRGKLSCPKVWNVYITRYLVNTQTLIIGQRISEKGGVRPAICWPLSSTPTRRCT